MSTEDSSQELLPIGRFALATGLSVKALRHYAEIGLLLPTRVDEHTGYRYYALRQIRQGAAIVRLRGLDVPLAEIARLLDADDTTVRQRLAAHRRLLAERARRTQESLDALDRIIDGKDELVPEKEIGRLAVRQVPARTYVITRDRKPMEELTTVIPQLIGTVAGWIFANGGPDGAPMARVDTPDQDGVTALEVGWPPAGPAEPPEPLVRTTYPETRAVVHRHVGPYTELHGTYAALEKAIAAAGLRPTGPARESYETNPEEEPDTSTWVTEIIWPVA